MQTVERQFANQLVHQARVVKILSRTGGEIIHPDHYDLREAVRLAVLRAIDETTTEVGRGKMSDGELPELFKTLDAISERVFMKSIGL